MIILDFGSGNTCRNSIKVISDMINELAAIDPDRRCIIKWQLFLSAGENKPLSLSSFKFAYDYAKELGFQTTASVFDLQSLQFLMKFNVPFIKIANRFALYTLLKKSLFDFPVVASWNGIKPKDKSTFPRCCVSKYPASLRDYEDAFDPQDLMEGISDHTTDWALYRKYRPNVYECHYKLYASTGLDAGTFARTPNQLREILK